MRPHLIRAAALAACVGLASVIAPAATPPAAAAEPFTGPMAGAMPMADYLALLARIAPAAEEGARAYLQAFEQRCGRALRTSELRRAMSEGDGDPVLMAMIRSSHLRDTTALGQLGQRITCEDRAAR